MEECVLRLRFPAELNWDMTLEPHLSNSFLTIVLWKKSKHLA